MPSKRKQEWKSASAKVESDFYQYETQKIRNERNRAGVAGDDEEDEDEYIKGEDESIDDDASEVGWNSDDELAFGKLFNKKGKEKLGSNDASEDFSDEENAREGEIMLSDLLSNDKSNSDENLKNKQLISTNKNVENEDDDDDMQFDDIDYSEDDRGSGDDSDDNEDHEIGNGDDDEEDDNEESHSRLLTGIERILQSSSKGNEASKKSQVPNQSAPESAFSINADDGAVSMDALLGVLSDTKDLNTVKRQLNDLKRTTKAPTFVEKVVSDRVERTMAYAETSKEMAKWQSAVVSNRSARTLDLAQDKRQVPSYKDLVKRYEPVTEMEREVEMVLVKTGATESQVEEREHDELGRRNMTEDEIREKQSELAKIKALLFYEQMKRHRLNKIKSKAYRRIRKKQRERKEADEKELLAEADPEGAREIEEAEAMKRVKERMDLKHKNTGKWARMALQHAHRDDSLRMAYHEAVELGQEISKKINEVPSSTCRSDDDSDDDRVNHSSESEGEDNGRSGSRKKKLLKDSVSQKAAREILNVLGGTKMDSAEAEARQGKYKKLYEMDFMKRAADQQRERARQEAGSILREIQMMEEEEETGEEEEETDWDRGKDREDVFSDLVGTDGKMKSKKRRSAEELAAAKKLAEEKLGYTTNLNGSDGRSRGRSVGGLGMLVMKSDRKTGKVKVSGPLTVGSTTNKNNHVSEIGDLQSEEDKNEDHREAAEEAKNPWLLTAVPLRTGRKRSAEGQRTDGSEGIISIINQDYVKNDVENNLEGDGGAADAGRGKAANKRRKGKNIMADDRSKPTAAMEGGDSNISSSALPTTYGSNTGGRKGEGDSSGAVQQRGEEATLNRNKLSSTTAPIAAKNDDKTKKNSANSSLPTRKPLLMQKTQEDLVHIAFAGPDLEADFTAFKKQTIDDELGIDEKKAKVMSEVKAGWGDWAGPGAGGISQRTLKKRDLLLKKAEAEANEKRAGRKDAKTPNVILSERRTKTAAKYKIDVIPHPFTSREEYERSIQMPLGEEWNASTVVRTNTKPAVLTRAGRVIEVMKLPKGGSAQDKKRERDSHAEDKGARGPPAKSSSKKAKK